MNGSIVEGKRYTNIELVKDFWRFIGPGKLWLVLATIARMGGDIAWLYPPIALAIVINIFTTWKPGDSLDGVYWQMGLWLGAVAVRFGLHYFAKLTAWRVSERAAIDAELTGIRYLLRLDMSWHEKENAGNKLKRIESGGRAIDKLVRIWIGNFIEIGVNFIAISLIMGTLAPALMVAFVLFILSFTVLSTFLMYPASRAARAVNAKEEELSGLFFEGLNNIRTVKVLGMTPSILKIMEAAANELYSKVRRRISWFQFRGFSVSLYANLFKLFGIMFILYGIVHGHYELGLIVIFNGYVNRVSESVTELSDVSQDFIVAKYSVRRLVEIFDAPVESDQEKGKVIFPKDWQQIELKDVSFAYDDRPVLDNLSLTIKRGERIGVVGLSGAGKSTLFKLLLKENEKYSGEILIDQTPLKSIKKSSYYERAAVVLQDTEVFNFSLKENITIGKKNPGKKDDGLGRALETAHVTDFIDRLPEGLQTMIGEKGVKLSGGERQRVGIARAVFKDPEILFLDEATSHLDLESEEKIQDSLHTFFKGVTAVVIAHRLTTIKEMDRIILLENGRILESGTFEELQRKQGRFHELWEKQRLG